MNRKPVTVLFSLLLVVMLLFSGCGPKSASPPLSEEDAMSQEAAGNTTPVATEVPTEVPTEQPTDAPTPVPTAEPTEAATPAPTVEPTEAATPAPTVEPTEAPVVSTTPGTHVVQVGENLYRIALRYGTTVTAIAHANGITNVARIYPGQKLTIPAGTPGETPAPTPPPTTGGVAVHVVQPGENLFRIALRYNYDQYYIARYNGISNPALIYPGQSIRIPGQ